MSDFSKWLGDNFGWGPDSPENNAIGDAKRLAAQNQADAKSDREAATAKQNASLNHFLTTQGTQFKGLLGDIMSKGRQRASQSGLIGGTQEANIVNPMVNSLTDSFSNAAINATDKVSSQQLQGASSRELNANRADAKATGLHERSILDTIGGVLSPIMNLFDGKSDNKEQNSDF